MQSYLEASLAFMESKEMRDYLREELPKFRSMASYCAEIVALAPAPIERKLPVLEQITREAAPKLNSFGQPSAVDATRFAQSCRTALEERYSGPEGTMFWLQSDCYDKDILEYVFNGDSSLFTTFFTEFDAAIRYLEKLAEEEPDNYSFEGLSYTITKYVPNGKGELEKYCTWYLNNAREIWYFEHVKHQDFWSRVIDYIGALLSLPVPFRAGDIVMADCLPYAPPQRVLILDVGDNLDYCSIQALSIGGNDYLDASAFKHNGFLTISDESSRVSGLYRAARWTGELPAEEEVFAVLSPLIHAKPELGKEIGNYIRRGIDARTWAEVKATFGL